MSFFQLKIKSKKEFNKIIDNILTNNKDYDDLFKNKDDNCTINNFKIKLLGKEGMQGKIYSGKYKNNKLIIKETKKKTNLNTKKIKKGSKIIIYSNNFTNQTLIGFGLMKYCMNNFYNIVDNYGYLICKSKGYNILDFINRGDISEFEENFLKKKSKKLQNRYIDELIIQFTLAINHLQHEADFVHNDLKTKNVFIDSRSNKLSKYKTTSGIIKRKIKYFTLKIADFDKSSMTYKEGKKKYRFLSHNKLCLFDIFNFKIKKEKKSHFQLLNNKLFIYCATRHFDVNTDIGKSIDIITFLTSCLGYRWFFDWASNNGIFDAICDLIYIDDRKKYIKIIIDYLFNNQNPDDSLGIILDKLVNIRIYLYAHKYWLKTIVKKFKLKK